MARCRWRVRQGRLPLYTVVAQTAQGILRTGQGLFPSCWHVLWRMMAQLVMHECLRQRTARQ
mgnify:CR=1 FL=1